MRYVVRAIAGALLLAVVSCEMVEEAPLPPPDPPGGSVADIEVDSAAITDTAITGRNAAIPVTLRAVNAQGAPVPNARIIAMLMDSSSYRVLTADASGKATTTFTLDSATSQQLLGGAPPSGARAVIGYAMPDPAQHDRIGTLEPVEVRVPVRGRRLGPVELVSGGSQTIVALRAAAQIRFRLRDEFGSPVMNYFATLTPLDEATRHVFLVEHNLGATNERAFTWTPGNRLGPNRMRIAVHGATPLDVTVTQTLPADATLSVARRDTVDFVPVTGTTGICRRLPIEVRLTAPTPVFETTIVPLLGADVQVTATRPAGALRCPNTTSDTVTRIVQPLQTETQGVLVLPFVLGANAGTTQFETSVAGRTSTLNITAARFAASATFSDTVRVAYQGAQQAPVTVMIRDTLGTALPGVTVRVQSQALGDGVFWSASPTSYITNASGTFSLTGITVPGLLLTPLNMSVLPQRPVLPTEISLESSLKQILPVNSGLVFQPAPATTVARNAVWTVTTRARGGPTLSVNLPGVPVTATRTSGPAAVATQELATNASGVAQFTYTFSVAGTYIITFTTPIFPSIQAMVTVP